ncbi:MAG: outer membrane lipoprotein carrier protein LolA [Alphaproteobacteria bacterium]
MTGALLGLALGTFMVPAQAASPLSVADQQTVARAEAALNSIRIIESRFIQWSSIGGFAQGTIYVSRPGNLRIDYAPPTPLQVYGDSSWLIYLDYQLEESNQVPIDVTPASFLVRDRLSLSDDLTVMGIERSAKQVILDVVRTEEPDAGTLRIMLDKSGLALRGWVVIDPQGVQTRITLIEPAFNRPIDKNVFIYSPPDWALELQDPPQ